MTTDLASVMSQLKSRWMIGGAALDAAPEGWRAALDGDPNPELALFAIAGQMSQTALCPAPSGPLTPLPVLPRLSLPPLPDHCRAQFRRVLTSRSAPEDMAQILHLLAARGWSAHPADYMPKSFTALPAIYAPWADWTDARPDHAEETLTAENWDLWYPAERREMLMEMRQTDPIAAQKLIAAKAGELPADQRLRVIKILEHGLTTDDADYLTSLDADRSAKVKTLANRLLARLGQAQDDAEITQEFADFFTISTSGLLRRSKTLIAKPLKTAAQRNRRADCAQKISLQGFATAMGLDQTELVAMWDAESDATDTLVTMTADTGSDAAVVALTERLGSADAFSPDHLAPLAQRLGQQARGAALANALAKTQSFAALRPWADGSYGALPAESLLNTPALKALNQTLSNSQTEDRHRTDWRIVEDLFTLGLLANQNAAETLIETFKSAGLFGADPALNLLALNAALKTRKP